MAVFLTGVGDVVGAMFRRALAADAIDVSVRASMVGRHRVHFIGVQVTIRARLTGLASDRRVRLR